MEDLQAGSIITTSSYAPRGKLLVKAHVISALQRTAQPFYGGFTYIVNNRWSPLTYTMDLGAQAQGQTVQTWSDNSKTYCVESTYGADNPGIISVNKTFISPSYYYQLASVASGTTTATTVIDDLPTDQYGNTNTLLAQAQTQVRQPALSCTPDPVIRGSTVNCQATGLAAERVTHWDFEGGGGTANRSGGVLSWSGEAVAAGTVTMTTNGGGNPTANFEVSARNWQTSAVSAAKVNNGVIVTLPVPPMRSGEDGGVGKFAVNFGDPGFSHTIVGSGPNQGFLYYSAQFALSTHTYRYTINPDLENSSSLFSLHNCGQSGYISQVNLLSQTIRHEAGAVTQSHYVNYFNGLANSSNNPGAFVESRVAPPGADGADFNNGTRSGLTVRYNAIGSIAAVEPYPVNSNELGQFLGNINYTQPCP